MAFIAHLTSVIFDENPAIAAGIALFSNNFVKTLTLTIKKDFSLISSEEKVKAYPVTGSQPKPLESSVLQEQGVHPSIMIKR